jgi:hypothetical protein
LTQAQELGKVLGALTNNVLEGNGGAFAYTIEGGGACLATDQRGLTQPQGAGCDVGAFEVEP